MTVDYGQPDPAPTADPDLLDQACERVDSHNQRVDSKAGVLCALNLGALGLAGAALTRTGLPGWVTASVAVGTVGPLVFSTLTALAAFLPNLDGAWGFVAYAQAGSADEVAAAVERDRRQQSARLAGLSWAVYRKYRRLRVATQLAGAGITVGVVVAAAAGLSRLF